MIPEHGKNPVIYFKLLMIRSPWRSFRVSAPQYPLLAVGLGGLPSILLRIPLSLPLSLPFTSWHDLRALDSTLKTLQHVTTFHSTPHFVTALYSTFKHFTALASAVDQDPSRGYALA